MRTVSGSEFQTDGAENRKARLEIEGCRYHCPHLVCAWMALNIPIPSHSHLFNSHSLPSHSQFFDLFPFRWDSRVGYSHSLPFPFCQC